MFRKVQLYKGVFESDGGRRGAAGTQRYCIAGDKLEFGNEKRTFCGSRRYKFAGWRILDAGIVTRMTENAALFVGADVPMHNRREGGDGEYRHHQQQAQPLQRSTRMHHRRNHTPLASANTILLYSRRRFPMRFVQVFLGFVCAGLLISAAGCSSKTVNAAPLSPNYSAAQEALAVDDYDKAKTALTALAAESSGDFQKEVQAAASAADIETMRMSFRSASDILIKNGVPAQYAVAYCPMYKGGSSWVQKKGSIVNPYTGKSMPGCGVFKE